MPVTNEYDCMQGIDGNYTSFIGQFCYIFATSYASRKAYFPYDLIPKSQLGVITQKLHGSIWKMGHTTSEYDRLVISTLRKVVCPIFPQTMMYLYWTELTETTSYLRVRYQGQTPYILYITIMRPRHRTSVIAAL